MSNMKCPFCQQELDYDDLLCSCINEKCEESFDMVGTELLWQKVINLQDDLIDTKKKLEYAITMLERIAVSPETMLEPEKIIPYLAAQAIEQITTLEQKD